MKSNILSEKLTKMPKTNIDKDTKLIIYITYEHLFLFLTTKLYLTC